jgi:hypothetical protein
MRKMTMTIAVVVAGLSVAATARTTAQRAPAGAGQPVADAMRSSWDGAKKNIKESADVMPEANYAFKPAADVRTFGAILAHLAGANYMFCAAGKGEKSPHAEDEFEKSATTRWPTRWPIATRRSPRPPIAPSATWSTCRSGCRVPLARRRCWARSAT